MRQVFVKELSAFSVDSLALRLDISFSRAAVLVEVLTTRGVLRLRSGGDAGEFDVGDVAKLKGLYQFCYVGLTIFEDLVIIVYPKYMHAGIFAGDVPDQVAKDKLQRFFRVLRRSSGSFSDIASPYGGAKKFNDRIACMLMLIDMYDEYGVYSNYVRTFRVNGTGFVSWERTLAMHQPVMSNGCPVYFEYESIANTKDDTDYISRLHECVLTECYAYMKESGLSQILALDEIDLSHEALDDFGDKAHILYRLENERGVQYVTWKQDVLDLLARYVDEDESVVRSDEVICLGSSSFYNVWEKACKVAFGDLLDKRLGILGFPLVGKWNSLQDETLLGIVPSPRWTYYVDGNGRNCEDVSTLIPDIVAIWEYGENQRAFAILDAKYYTPQMSGRPIGVPGVESVTKQVLYQRAFRDFILDHEFDCVVNAFLVPSDGECIELLGHVDFPGVFDSVEHPLSNGVDMWMVPADEVFEAYLTDSHLSAGMLKMISASAV